MAVLAYLSWLVLIPLFAAKDSKFARFHVNQGLVLAISEIVWWIAIGIIRGIFIASLNLGIIASLGVISVLLNTAVSIGFLVLLIIGIVNAVNGQKKELPIIGGIRILKD